MEWKIERKRERESLQHEQRDEATIKQRERERERERENIPSVSYHTNKVSFVLLCKHSRVFLDGCSCLCPSAESI